MLKWYFLFSFYPHFLLVYKLFVTFYITFLLIWTALKLIKIDEMLFEVNTTSLHDYNRNNKDKLIEIKNDFIHKTLTQIKKYIIITIFVFCPFIILPSQSELYKIYIANKLITHENIELLDNISHNSLEILNNKLHEFKMKK